MAMQTWKIYLYGREIDTVHYAAHLDKWWVKHTLINHDGYSPHIAVVRSY